MTTMERAIERAMDGLVACLRALPIRGRGRLLNGVTPRQGTRRVHVPGGRLRIDLANVIHRQIYMGCFGWEMTRWTRTLLPRGGCFLDIGAHMGYFSLLAANRVGPAGRVVAVEPNPTTFAALGSHVRENGLAQVEPRQVAFGAEAGMLRLYAPPAGDHRDYNVTHLSRVGWQPIDVPMQRLSEALDAWGVERADVCKIDVEGAEPTVFAGGEQVLRDGRIRHLLCEVNGPRLVESGSAPRELVRRLAAVGFRPARLAGRRAIPVDASTWNLADDHEADRLFVHDHVLREAA